MSDPRKTVRLQVPQEENVIERDGVLYKAWKHDGFYFFVKKGVTPYLEQKGFAEKIICRVDDAEYHVDVPEPPAEFYRKIERRHDNFHGVLGLFVVFIFPVIVAFCIVEHWNSALKWMEFWAMLFTYGFLYLTCADRYKKWVVERLEKKKRRAFEKWKADHELIFVP